MGATLQTSAQNAPHLIIGRVITGFGTGIDSSTVPMYQSELCRKEVRGRLVSWEVLFIGIGISFAYWLDFAMSYAGGQIAWRLPIAVQLVFAMSVIILLFGLPESPRWLLKRGREREAIEVMCQVYDLPVEDEYIQSELKAIKHAISMESGSRSHMALFRNDKLKTRRRVMLAYFGLFMNQMVGKSTLHWITYCYCGVIDPFRHQHGRLLHAHRPRHLGEPCSENRTNRRWVHSTHVHHRQSRTSTRTRPDGS